VTWRLPSTLANQITQDGLAITSVEPASIRSEFNPTLFKPEAIDSETRAFNAQLAIKLADSPARGSQPVSTMREAQEAGRSFMGPIVLSDMAENRTIPGPGGPMTLRTFIPETVNGIYLHLHGGGWVLGGAHMQDAQLEATAIGAQLAVVSLEYRLAPEHPYPAAPDDCEAAALWLTEHAQSEFGSTRLLIGGPSAGAHLAVSTLLRLRDKHQLRSFSRANLVFGAYDLAMTPSAQHATDTLILSTRVLEWHIAQFGVAGKERDPDVSPLRADLRDLPTALFTVGTLDLLLDDTLFMYSRWTAAGNQAELDVYPGGVHGFTIFPYELAQHANQRMIDFLTN
jgi:acetyl esterase/lipase